MRDDFSLFDSYEYAPCPAHLPKGFPVPMQTYYNEKDKRITKAHVAGWQAFTTEAFSSELMPGNHLFFYDNPARAKYMETVVSKLPAGFR